MGQRGSEELGTKRKAKGGGEGPRTNRERPRATRSEYQGPEDKPGSGQAAGRLKKKKKGKKKGGGRGCGQTVAQRRWTQRQEGREAAKPTNKPLQAQRERGQGRRREGRGGCTQQPRKGRKGGAKKEGGVGKDRRGRQETGRATNKGTVASQARRPEGSHQGRKIERPGRGAETKGREKQRDRGKLEGDHNQHSAPRQA